MNKRYVHISDCTEGCILAKDIVNNFGVKIVAENTVINEFIKNKLTELNINHIWVVDSASDNRGNTDTAEYEKVKENYVEDVLVVKKILLDVAAGNRIDYQKIADISDSIYKEINSANIIIKCLNELKNADEYTYVHSVNVSVYAMLIARWMELSREDIKNIIQAGILHDIGKLKVPKEILNKKGKLTAGEFEEIKKHTLYGYEILKRDNCLNERVQEAVLLHHERIDGSGYPYGMKGIELNLYSKIVAIADVYDAMISDRIYKKKVTPFDAFEMFITEGIGIFDTTLLKAFLSNLPTYYIGANVVLNNGLNGEIAYIPPQDIICPIIKLKSDYVDLARVDGLRIKNIV